MKRRVLEKLKLTEISGVDKPCQEHARVTIMKRDFTQEQRDAAAKTGAAMKDGSYPIKNRSDLENAVQAFGRAKNKAAVKAHIMSRAKTLGCEDCLPESWSLSKRVDELKKRVATLNKSLNPTVETQPVQDQANEALAKFWSVAARLAAIAARQHLGHAVNTLRLAAMRGPLNPFGHAARAAARRKVARTAAAAAAVGAGSHYYTRRDHLAERERQRKGS